MDEKSEVAATEAGANGTSDRESLAAALIPALEDLPRVPQQARSREKRDELLRSAAALFSERGYAAVTADEIAAHAGVSVGTFYNYFRNKRQILLTIVIERLEDIFSHLRLGEMDLSQGDQRAVIRQAIAAVLDGEQTGLRRVWLELMSLEPELIPYQQHVRRFALEHLEERLRVASEQGKAWPGLDVGVTALGVLTLLDSLSLHSYEQLGEHFGDERILDGLTDFIYRAIFPPGTAAAAPSPRDEDEAAEPRQV